MTMETFWPTQFTVMLTINSTDPKGKTEYVTVLLIEAFRPLQIFTRRKMVNIPLLYQLLCFEH